MSGQDLYRAEKKQQKTYRVGGEERKSEMQRSAEEERGMAIPFAGVGCLFLRLTLRFDKDILYCPHGEICLGLVNTPGAPYALGRPSG